MAIDLGQGHEVVIELLALICDVDGGRIGFRSMSALLPENADPDDVALALARDALTEPTVCHSTSWRWTDENQIVLTYATVTGHDGLSGVEWLDGPAVVSSGELLKPRPDYLHAHHVAAHAIKHLASLATTDPEIGRLADEREPDVWAALVAHAGDIPTATHAHAHELASRMN